MLKSSLDHAVVVCLIFFEFDDVMSGHGIRDMYARKLSLEPCTSSGMHPVDMGPLQISS